MVINFMPANFQIRLKEVIEYSGKTLKEFAADIGFSTMALYNYLNKEDKVPSVPFYEKVIELYPEISLEWLILGKGMMLSAENISNTKADILDEINTNGSSIVHIPTTIAFIKHRDTVYQFYSKQELVDFAKKIEIE